MTNNFLCSSKVVVLTTSSADEQEWVGEFCHNEGIKFIVADTRGLFGYDKLSVFRKSRIVFTVNDKFVLTFRCNARNDNVFSKLMSQKNIPFISIRVNTYGQNNILYSCLYSNV